jgi:hypothetical protein
MSTNVCLRQRHLPRHRLESKAVCFLVGSARQPAQVPSHGLFKKNLDAILTIEKPLLDRIEWFFLYIKNWLNNLNII